MESLTTSPAETRTALERTITYNYEAMVKARSTQPNNNPNELAALFEQRMNVALTEYLGVISVTPA